MRLPQAIRPAFSLLEMVLALALGMVLLLAVYVLLNTHIMVSQLGRDTLAEGVLARNIMTRITADVNGQLGPVDPRVLPDPDAVANGTASTPAPAAGAAAATPATMAAPSTGVSSGVAFNLGVYGQPNYVILSGYRVRKPPANAQTNVPDTEITSDLQRTAYWIVGSGTENLGLARAEIKQATSPDIDLDPSNLPEQNKYIFAPEVKSILFEYYNGTAWQPDWDGLFSEGQGIPPNGPPAGIRVTITLRRTDKGAVEDPNADGPTYQQVIALPTANAFPAKTATGP